MKYKVTKRYSRGSDTPFAAFSDKQDALLFIDQKAQEDARLTVKVVYSLLEFDEVIEVFDPDKRQETTQQDSQSSQGKTSTASFRPSPFNNAPRPSGTPPKWLKDDEEK